MANRQEMTAETLPRTVAIGLGCERNAEEAEIWALIEAALAEANVGPEAVACIASIASKVDEPALHSIARRLDVPLHFFPAARLEQETPRLKNPSDLVFRETGCHGVAEGAALAFVGADGDLILPKRRSAHATCALARMSFTHRAEAKRA
jgi:cobalt-precorrin 5A hydrolase/precorrin-3B C17-methyltransferase